MSDKPSFVQELKRRRVFRTAAVYAAAAFVVGQAADLIVPGLLLPDWTFRLVIILLILGFPVALVLSWAFDLTSEGVRGAGEAQGVRRAGEAGSEASAPEGDRPPAGRPPRWLAYGAVAVVLAFVGLGGYAFWGLTPEGARPAAAIDHSARQVIAVLPLTSLAGGDENEYFADGITEDILMNLGLVPEFAVISRTSVMRYKRTDRSVPEIALELGAAYVLEGSLRRVGDQIRVVLQLIEASSDTPVWASAMDRRIEDIFALQSEIAHAVVDALRVELTGAVDERLDRAPTTDLVAYDLFLRGRDLTRQGTPSAVEEGFGLLREAVNRDPEFALAHALLGTTAGSHYFNFRTDRTMIQTAFSSARRAIELQPDLGDGHRALGGAYVASGRSAEAIPAFQRALELNPSDAAALNNLGLAFALTGAWDRALEMGRRSVTHEPGSGHVSHLNLANYYRILGMYDQGRTEAYRSAELNPEYWAPPYSLAWMDVSEGRPQAAVDRLMAVVDQHEHPQILNAFAWVLLVAGAEAEALPLLERVYALAPDMTGIFGPAPAVHLAHLVHRGGDEQRALEILARIERVVGEVVATGDSTAALCYSLAGAAAIRGDREAALDWLERAAEQGWNQPVIVQAEPLFATLRDEPRFRAIIEGMEARIEAQRSRVERENL